MTTPTLFSNNSNTFSVTIPKTSANLVGVTVLPGPGIDELKQLVDVFGANSGANGYVLELNTNGTSNTSDDTYNFVPNNLDGGSF